jgi:hypothetical protein
VRKKRPPCSEGPHFEDEMFVLQRSRPARVATGFLQFSIMLLLNGILHQSATKQRNVEGKFTTEQDGNVAPTNPRLPAAN